jgi:uncharacterized protein (TIGR02271 family)
VHGESDATDGRCAMSWSTDGETLGVGDEVFGSDGYKVGVIAEVQPGYIVVEKGFFFPSDYFIPLSAVASAANGRVELTVSKEVALHSGWETLPDDQSAPVDIAAAIADVEVPRTEVRVADKEEIRIPVMQEELTATVRPAEVGAVRIEKRIVAEDQVLEVPVTEEQIRVERRIVDRPVGDDETAAFEQIVIEVPLTAETVELEKQARVAEEIVVTKETVQRTERIADTVRREEVYVDDDTVADATLRVDGERDRRGGVL